MTGGTTLNGRVAIVTGGGRGIGRAIALALARAGAAVAVVGRSDGHGPGTVAATAADIVSAQGQALALRGDVRSSECVRTIVDATVSSFGRLDILVNNAGIFFPGARVQDLDTAVWDETIDTNLRGTFLFCRYALPHLIAAGGGSIINLGSSASDHCPGQAGNAAYAAAKAGVVRFTQVLAEEVQADGIAVNCMQPMSLLTDGVLHSAAQVPQMDLANFAAPEAIGPALVYLAAQRAGFSGHVVRRTDFVDGRFTQTF